MFFSVCRAVGRHSVSRPRVLLDVFMRPCSNWSIVGSLFISCLLSQIFVRRSMSSSQHSTCFTTVSNDDDARRLARAIVESRLAACVNLIPGVRSIYEWQSVIHEDQEIILMIKTRRDAVAQLIEFIKKNHPYELPELIELPIDGGNPAYLNWIDDIVRGKTSRSS
jgi:periplasmic divalent cation tolerance protein